MKFPASWRFLFMLFACALVFFGLVEVFHLGGGSARSQDYAAAIEFSLALFFWWLANERE